MAEIARMPALTDAESDVVDGYLAVLDCLARINPGRADHTYGALRAAQALVARAADLRDALARMFERGETSVHAATLARALRLLDGSRRVARLDVPEPRREA